MVGDPQSIRARRRAGSLLCALTVSVFVACGGSAVDDPGSGGHAGGGSVAGAGAGGSAASDACTAAQAPGQCEAYFPSFWHDPKTNLCVPFVYGGCGGNANRYPSREACMQACPTASDDWSACENDSSCTSISTGCCGACEPVASEQLVAINFAHLSAYENSHCSDTPPCVPCRPITEIEQTGKYFKPVCRNAHCTLIDTRESPLSECQKNSDCFLRDGAECCAECDGSGWVPLNKTADLCGGVPIGCDDCASLPPNDLDVVCLSGRCSLVSP
jgi:hypothetical protein